MKTSRMLSFTGSMAALAVMTVLSVLIGQLFHAIPPTLAGGFPFDDAVAALAFLYFGIKTLKVDTRGLCMQHVSCCTKCVC
jgi:putative Ca2+/H+ antiporter (TMEM165/GDT1 family)